MSGNAAGPGNAQFGANRPPSNIQGDLDASSAGRIMDVPDTHAVDRQAPPPDAAGPPPAGRTIDISGTTEARRDDTAPPPSGGTDSSMAGKAGGGQEDPFECRR